MQLIKLICSSNMLYMPDDAEGESITRDDLLLVKHFTSDDAVTEELLSELEIDVIKCKGDWLQTSYQMHETYIEFQVTLLQFASGLENIVDHEEYLNGLQEIVDCIQKCFQSRFDILEYRTTRRLGIDVVVDGDDTEEQDFLRLRVIDSHNLGKHPLIQELNDEKINYEIVNKTTSLTNTGASGGFVEALILVVGKAVVSGVAGSIGKFTLEKVVEKYKGKNELIQVENLKIKFSKIKNEISSMLDLPVSVLDFHSITTCGETVNISFVYRRGLELILIHANCSLKGKVNYLDIEEPAYTTS